MASLSIVELLPNAATFGLLRFQELAGPARFKKICGAHFKVIMGKWSSGFEATTCSAIARGPCRRPAAAPMSLRECLFAVHCGITQAGQSGRPGR